MNIYYVSAEATCLTNENDIISLYGQSVKLLKTKTSIQLFKSKTFAVTFFEFVKSTHVKYSEERQKQKY